MAKHPTLLQHFRSFVYQNDIDDFDEALAYFTVFGGTGWDVDTSKPLDELIEEKILRNYEALHEGIIRYTHGNGLYHMLLSIIALGVDHEEEVFKKARVGKDKGIDAIDYLEMKSLLKFDLSVEKPLHEADRKSDKIGFNLPFMRFWFAVISPYYKSISEGDFSEFKQKWEEIRSNFHIVLSNLLVREMMQLYMKNKETTDALSTIGTYYDKHTHIEVCGVHTSGKMFAGVCKYALKPAKVNMLETIKQKCERAQLDVQNYVLFSKHGFTKELLACQDEKVSFLGHKDLARLIENLSSKDLLVYKNKKY